MPRERLSQWRRSVEALFPERHLYIRSGGEMRAYVLSTGRQMVMAGALAVVALWLGVGTAALMVGGMSAGSTEREVARVSARYERLIADREARLNSAMVQLTDTGGSAEQLAEAIEKRQQMLAMLFDQFTGGSSNALAQLTPVSDAAGNPIDRLRASGMDANRLVSQAEIYAKTRAERLRLALRLAGLDPASYARAGGASLGGPLIDAKDPRALAVVLDVPEDVARRVQAVAREDAAAQSMQGAVDRLPLGRPTANTRRASGFGVRLDPFNRTPAFHSGLDFAGPMYTPVYATAPGVVSFTGSRSGYGNTIEIDHGRGFKTRYAHLQGIAVARGQRVGVGQRIGAMGSTGRSTGPHLHYEVWVNGRAQNPDRFLRAGDYVHKTIP